MINLFISRNLIVQENRVRKCSSAKKTGCQLQVTLVVMITQLREGEPPNQRTKAEQYWPDRCAAFVLHFVLLGNGRQGGRTWQPFVRGKNGHENFRQTRIYNFCDKCVVFARNRKFANLTK